MSEDLTKRLGSSEQGQKKTYIFINSMLHREGYSLASFPSMPQINEIENIDVTEQDVLPESANHSNYDKLNIRQKEVVNYVLSIVDNNHNNNINNNCIFIDGPGGSGKTFIYTTLCELLKDKNKNVCTMAYTGIAATLLPNGKTIHKTFGLPVPMFSDSSSNVKPNSKHGIYLSNVDVFIWDEAPMSPRYALEIANRTLQDIMNNDIPFGGKIMIMGGDFRQLLPVQVHATRTETINLSIKFSSLWKHFRTFSLQQNMRALPEETEFVQFLLDVGNGKINDIDDKLVLPNQCLVSTRNNIVTDVYQGIIRGKRYHELTGTAILSARNIDVDAINQEVIELLDISTEKIYTAVDSTENCDNGAFDDAILTEYLNTLNPPNIAPYELRLRQYAIVMLIRNLSLSEGLCNGTRLMITQLGTNVLRCKILTGDRTGDVVFINRITLYCENVYPFTFKRRQFPIKLAFCMTINKAQGQTFHKIGIDLTKDVFNHGQLYVALSRVRSWASLAVFFDNTKNDRLVKNYVYKELFV
ncbi:ATP-dependent DNA helicase pif1-like [Cotesia typhae]|uniref:ATP-dependent DNA helicase pif1-like n=1 Tax=Cotesia typhae TaxID=2053667 RepID=UPI003D682B78